MHKSEAVVVAFQDSEAFDINLVADLIVLFRLVFQSFSAIERPSLIILAPGRIAFPLYSFLELPPRLICFMSDFRDQQAVAWKAKNLTLSRPAHCLREYSKKPWRVPKHLYGWGLVCCLV